MGYWYGDSEHCRKCYAQNHNFAAKEREREKMDNALDEDINNQRIEYRENRDNYRQRGYLYNNIRFSKKESFAKKARERTKNRRKKLTFTKRQKDKKGKYESKRKFRKEMKKKRCLMN